MALTSLEEYVRKAGAKAGKAHGWQYISMPRWFWEGPFKQAFAPPDETETWIKAAHSAANCLIQRWHDRPAVRQEWVPLTHAYIEMFMGTFNEQMARGPQKGRR